LMTLKGKGATIAGIVLYPGGAYILPYGHIQMQHICSLARR